MDKKISVIIPNYNREKLIGESLNSLLSQTYAHWEAIVVDDGSGDNSVAIIEDFAEKDARIKLLQRDRKPKGAAACRNIGIEKATGKHIIFLDSDDLLKPFALKQRANVIKNNPNYDYWIFQTVNFEETPENEKETWNNLSEVDNLTRFFKLDSVWHTSGPVWKAETLKNLKFDEKLKCWQDVDFHLQALLKKLKYKTFFDISADVLYRRHSVGSISQGGFNKEKRKSQFYFLKKYLNKVEKDEHKSILINLYKNILKKNIQSRYYFNALEMVFWKIFNR